MHIVLHATIAALLAAATSTVYADYIATDLTPPRTGSDITSGDPTTAIALAVTSGQQAGVAQVNGSEHAYFWTGAAPGTDDNGAADNSTINALAPTQAVGYIDNANILHAAFWTPPNPAPQLLPEGVYTNTEATGVAGSIIVGLGALARATLASHALFWTSPTAPPTDLHNFAGVGAAYDSSNALGTDGNRVVGNATPAGSLNIHAALWNISTGKFTDLHNSTTGFLDSQALSVAGNQVVGFGVTDDGDSSNTHALLWTLSGPNDSIIAAADINPAGYDVSVAAATNGTLIVGYAIDDGNISHAIVWSSPTSFQLLPTPDGDSSQALGIDPEGDIVGDITDADGNTDAILWSPASVPEPATAALLIPALLLLHRRRK